MAAKGKVITVTFLKIILIDNVKFIKVLANRIKLSHKLDILKVIKKFI